jgi:hypothetical protein
MSRLSKAIILGFLIGVVGLAIGLASFGLHLEENIGLDLLFTLRGARQPPPDVVIVSIDLLKTSTFLKNRGNGLVPSMHASLKI